MEMTHRPRAVAAPGGPSAGCQGASAGCGLAVSGAAQHGGMTYSILADGLVKRFGQTRALNGIDLAVRTGSVFGLLGPNGAGKTTAVHILATLVRPDGGHATICVTTWCGTPTRSGSSPG
jgi:ABC-type glutathione transport system ATPase component